MQIIRRSPNIFSASLSSSPFVYIIKQMLLVIAVRALLTTRERENWQTTWNDAPTSRPARLMDSTLSACFRKRVRRLCRLESFHQRWRQQTRDRQRRQRVWESPVIIRTCRVRQTAYQAPVRVRPVPSPSTVSRRATITVIQETTQHYLIGKSIECDILTVKLMWFFPPQTTQLVVI